MGATGSATASDMHLLLEDAPTSPETADAPRSPAPQTLPHPGAALPDARAPCLSLPGKARLKAMMTTHFNFIWRSLKRLGVPHADVDDCTQQVFLVASRKLPVITEGSEQAFLFGTALNVAAEARR